MVDRQRRRSSPTAGHRLRAAPRLYAVVPSAVGRLLLTADGDALTGLAIEGGRDYPAITDGWREDAAWFRSAAEQLDAYFEGDLRAFDLPLAPLGTPFQERVWRALLAIPLGSTATYGALAAALGAPLAARAVGAANGQNPIAIVIPCHRLVGTHGALTGYGGGLARKAWLLAHERWVSGRPSPPGGEGPLAAPGSRT